MKFLISLWTINDMKAIMQELMYWLFGIVWVYNKLMNTPSMIVSLSTILLQPYVGRFLPQNGQKFNFLPTFRQCLANKWRYGSM